MYDTKVLEEVGGKVLAYQSTWLVKETISTHELTICPRAVLTAPEGKFLTLTVNGVGKQIQPGTYKGDVVLSVTDAYHMAPGGLMRMNQIGRQMNSAIVIKDGKVAQTVPAILQGGEVADGKTEGVYMASSEECFNGMIISGDGEYTVKGVKADFEGYGDNDFLGVGCAVTIVDDAKVTVEDCDFTMSGITRCAFHVGGHSDVLVKNTKMQNLSPESEWPGSFSWQVGFCGNNRLAQLTDLGNVVYDNCDLKTNGWGILSIDGSEDSIKMVVKNSRLELSGPRAHGYGAFCIGENEIVFDNCDVDVYGYPMLLMGMEGLGKASILNSRIKGRRFGAMVIDDDNSVFTIKDSSFKTGKSTLCIKASATIIDIDNTTMEPANGTIVQLMDPDESGMNVVEHRIPVGEVDVALPDRDLSAASLKEDVVLNISNCDLKGNFYNSTTNIRAYQRDAKGAMGIFHDTVVGILPMFELPKDGEEAPPPMGPAARHNGDDLRGPKNLGLNLKNTKIEGVISSADQKYRDGLTVIREDERMELGNITQTAAPTINNGVCVDLDKDSAWTVTGTSYVTALTLAEGAKVAAPEGKKLTVTVDGATVELKAGAYTGKIVLTVE